MINLKVYLLICTCLSAFKLLFLKSYISTDFDVHRNWMAVTYNLPMKNWYFDTTSEWTLDYPPLFAAFEFLLSLLAHVLNLSDILQLTSESIRTEKCIIFQRATVILSDFLYYYSVYIVSQSVTSIQNNKNLNKLKSDKLQNFLQALFKPDPTTCLTFLLLLQPGLILVDHIHFQYNGFLNGFLLLSIANIITGRVMIGSFWYALLLNFKHIYLYCAPSFGMYLLTAYCFNNNGTLTTRVVSFTKKFIALGLVVASVFVIVYLPFADINLLRQILTRLFPFQRGLTHTYWAPNFWAIYNSADKLLALTSSKDSSKSTASSTSGIVQEYQHEYLPTITPATTFYAVAAFTTPMVLKFLVTKNKTSPILFLKGATVAAFTSFMFGWHVHEKAIIIVLIPLTVTTILDNKLARPLLRLTLAGTYSLFPLLFRPAEYPTKVTVLIFYYNLASKLSRGLVEGDLNPNSNKYQTSRPNTRYGKIIQAIDKYYVLMIVMVELYSSFIHNSLDGHSWNTLLKLKRLEFLPLLLTSLVSAFGVTLGYLELSWNFYLGR